MPTVAITGGSGFIGRALGARFAAKKWSVVNLTRRQSPDMTGAWTHFDLSAQDEYPHLQDVDVVIHAAYEKAVRGTDVVMINRSGTARLLEAARRSGVTQFIFLSSFSAHDQARSAYARQKRQIEDDVAQAGGMVVRPGLVLGHGGLFKAVVEQLRRTPLIPLIDGGRQPLQTVYIEDLCTALTAITGSGIRRSVNIAERDAVAYRDFFDTLAQHIGTRCRFVPISSWLALTGVRVASRLRIPLPITEDNVLGACDLRFRDTASDEQLLGITCRPFNESLSQLFKR